MEIVSLVNADIMENYTSHFLRKNPPPAFELTINTLCHHPCMAQTILKVALFSGKIRVTIWIHQAGKCRNPNIIIRGGTDTLNTFLAISGS